MKVLVACEFSGTVRDAFVERGHEAMSCDLLPTESPGSHHQGDVFDVLDDGWDLVIAHPPCTYLANSGVRWLYEPDDWAEDGGALKGLPREIAMEDAAFLFRRLLHAKAPRVAVENPVMHGRAAEAVFRTHDQTIQPWQFGDPYSKRTCLWLRGLPPLVPTNVVDISGMDKRDTHAVHHAPPGPDRWKQRSITYPGIAAAMADQWGSA